MTVPRKLPPENQGMSFRLASAVAEEPGASSSAAIVASGLFAIAASLDRLTGFFEAMAREDRAKERAAKAKAAS